MKRKLILMGASLVSIVPLTAVISCGGTNNGTPVNAGNTNTNLNAAGLNINEDREKVLPVDESFLPTLEL